VNSSEAEQVQLRTRNHSEQRRRIAVKKGRALRLLVACLGVGGLLLVRGSGPAWALDLYGIKVTPSFTYAGEYDDNVFRTQVNKRSDYANHFIPAITVEATPDKHEIRAGFKADFIRYSNFNNLDFDRWFANLSAVFKFNRLRLRLREDFAHTDDFPTSELTQRIPRNENYLGGGFDIDLYGQWGIGFDATWGDIYYLDHSFDFLSRAIYTYAPNVYYQLTAKTRVFAEYNYVQEFYKYEPFRNDFRNRIMLGVRGDLAERFTLSIKAGYQNIQFRDPSQEDLNLFVVFAEATYRPVERVAITLLMSQDPVAAGFTNNFTNTPFITTLGVTYALTPKITIIPRGYFEVDRFNQAVLDPSTNRTEKRLDYLYGGGIGIRYDLQKWIRLDAGYDYQGRNSNFNGFSYDDNRVTFSVALSL
jgi:hypothetical protein